MKTRLNSVCDRKNAILSDEVVFLIGTLISKFATVKKNFGPLIIFIFI